MKHDDAGSAPAAASIRVERLRWRSRRGLLELELLLRPFVDKRAAMLDVGALDDYERLLEFDDMDVHEWLMGRCAPPAELDAIVAEIRRFLAV